ncbi:MAG: 16S rRNA (cytosine(1402)-N(4))-methyltransferase RsmH [Chloroflexi bacterium]|nr:16S rRNA (cytosine(1402)-N(4))-methyltransferase RsmH [Chloroflexota bacterium]
MRPISHVPVLLNEALDLLRPRAGGRYVDGTVGGGGHAEAILERSSPDGRLLGLDLDPEALARAAERLKRFGDRVVLVHESFADLERVVRWYEFAPADGIILDLGVSSFQLAHPTRGFGFQTAAPLDMRFNPHQAGPTARELVNTLDAAALAEILRRYGEEPRAAAVARAIVQRRAKAPIETTTELAEIVTRVYGHRRGKIHPATRTFQALRIAVNRELEALERALPQAIEVLETGGRLVVIAFHSLEDRIVKHFFADQAATCVCPPGLPVCVCGRRPRVRILTRRPIRPSAEEIQANPRSRSAILRAVERLPEEG